MACDNYVELLIHPLQKRIAIRPAVKSNRYALQWTSGGGSNKEARCISGRAFIDTLFDIFGWNLDYKFKLYGCVYRDGKDAACIFSSSDLSVFIKEEQILATGIDKGGKLINLSGKRVRAHAEDLGRRYGQDYYVEKTMQEMVLQTKEQWQTRIEGRMCATGEKLSITPYEKLRAFIESVDLISDVAGEDIIGRVYEFFITHYAMDERKIRGEYFTPKSIVELMVELIEPFENSVYDPCFGTGGLFIQSAKLSQSAINNENLKLYGQEINSEMWRLAKLNLAMHGINADLGQKCVSVFTEDVHSGLKMDYILANPPFNLRSWLMDIDFEKDKRFFGYDLTKCANANYCWILHILSKLNENGVAGIVLSNSPLNSEEDYLIRKSLIEQDKIEAIIVFPREMFYSTDISVSLWIFNNNKKEKQVRGKILKDRSNQVLFVDLRSWNHIKNDGNFVCFDEEQIKKVKEIFNLWRLKNQQAEYCDVPELCKSASIDEIRKQNYNLVPSKYIDFEHKKAEMNFEEEMYNLISVLNEIKNEEAKSFKQLSNAIASLGYEL